MWNRLLQRQIDKHLGEKEIPPELIALLKAISHTYDDFDRDRKMLERSFEISSLELVELNENLRQDIILRKKAEEEKTQLLEVLKKSEDKFRVIFENSNVPTLLLDSASRFQDCNDSAVKLLKAKNRNQLLKTKPAILSAEFQPDGSNSLQRSVELNHRAFAGEALKFDWEHLCFDGSFLMVEVNLRLVFLEAQPMLLVHWHDLTERKKIEKLLQEISETKAHIMESILYAGKLQEASLPTEPEIQKTFPSSFVLFKPKDFISGDFYLVENILTKGGQNFNMILIGDCTGHGVPGAMLSFLFINILRQVLMERQFDTPSELLRELSHHIKHFYRSQREDNLLDGIDIGVAFIEENGNSLIYSNANRPLFRIRENQLYEVVRQRGHISFSMEFRDFYDVHLDLKKGDSVYLFSDGYVDQFGGEEQKKLMSKKFKDILLDMENKEPQIRKSSLDSFIENWKGKNKQTDDILILGITI
jgi:PAS domain S-box-containing protein